MTSFEWLSIVAYYLQLLVIGGGLWMMREAGLRRDRQIDQQGKVLEEVAASLREESASLREVVELSRAQRAEQSEQSTGIREQSASLREIVELSRVQRAEQSEQSAGIRALLERSQQP